MDSAFVPVILGIIISVLGISNMKGNISSIHRYHRKRITEETRLPFSRMVGLGTLICGVALIVFGIFSFIAWITNNDLFTIIGAVIVVIGLAAGLVLSLYAMIKYNKGIF